MENSIIVGSGIAGFALARRLAEEKNKQVLVVEKRNYIEGYCYHYRDKTDFNLESFKKEKGLIEDKTKNIVAF